MTHPEFVNVYAALPAARDAMNALDAVCRAGPLESALLELVRLRASQVNGCAYCIDMHHKEARAGGETEERLYMLPAWREATVYTDAERAALALTEAVTLIADGHVPPGVEAEARAHFDIEAYAALLFAIGAINVWNRVAIASHTPAGRHRPAASTH